MSEIISPVRKTNAWGKEIEPEFVARSVKERREARGVGIRLTGVEKSIANCASCEAVRMSEPASKSCTGMR